MTLEKVCSSEYPQVLDCLGAATAFGCNGQCHCTGWLAQWWLQQRILRPLGGQHTASHPPGTSPCLPVAYDVGEQLANTCNCHRLVLHVIAQTSRELCYAPHHSDNQSSSHWHLPVRANHLSCQLPGPAVHQPPTSPLLLGYVLGTARGKQQNKGHSWRKTTNEASEKAALLHFPRPWATGEWGGALSLPGNGQTLSLVDMSRHIPQSSPFPHWVAQILKPALPVGDQWSWMEWRFVWHIVG